MMGAREAISLRGSLFVIAVVFTHFVRADIADGDDFSNDLFSDLTP